MYLSSHRDYLSSFLPQNPPKCFEFPSFGVGFGCAQKHTRVKWLRNTGPLLALGAQFPPQPAGEGSISLGFLGLCIWLPFSPLSVFLAAEARLGCLCAQLSVHDVCFASPEVPVLTFRGILLMLG